MKKLVYVIFGLIIALLPQILLAQQFELGKVTKNELLERHHPADTSASAAILYEKGKTYFKYAGFYWIMVTEVERRIKIYKKSGYDFANQELSYYVGNSDYNTFSDACTYNLNGGDIIKTKLGSEHEFVQPVGEYGESKKIFFPDVKEGSIVEFKYTKMKRWKGYMPDWYFQEDMPMNSSEYTVAIPAYFTHHSIISGNIKVNSTPQVTVRGDGFQENRVTYSAKNIPAITHQPYVNNIDNYRPCVKHELVAFTNFAGEETKFATSWKSLVLSLFEDEDFGKQIEQQAYFKKDIDGLLRDGMTTEERINAVFNYVQNRMEWNKYVGFSCNQGVREAYKLKKGNTAEINLMLIAMLKYLKIDAVPVLLATKNKTIPQYPSLEAFNYVLCGVQLGGDFILLDATSKFTTPGLIRPVALNHYGRKIRPDGSAIEVDLEPKHIARSIYNIVGAISGDGGVSGKIRVQYSDYQAIEMREGVGFEKKEKYINGLEEAFEGTQISDHTFKNESPNPLLEEYSFTNSTISDIIGEKIIISPMLFFASKSNPFLAEERLYPIDFTYPCQYKYMITLTLPKGYTVQSSPESGSISMGDNIASFKYVINIKDNQLQLNVIFDINQAVIAKENYNALKEFYQKMIEKENNKLILKKA
ncbi:MAG: transglutaminase [Flavobacterium psychrophilum]|nr:MAG: transglutaminase [Flavobacterium psychrophilum]